MSEGTDTVSENGKRARVLSGGADTVSGEGITAFESAAAGDVLGEF